MASEHVYALRLEASALGAPTAQRSIERAADHLERVEKRLRIAKKALVYICGRGASIPGSGQMVKARMALDEMKAAP